jgi:starch synthase
VPAPARSPRDSRFFRPFAWCCVAGIALLGWARGHAAPGSPQKPRPNAERSDAPPRTPEAPPHRPSPLTGADLRAAREYLRKNGADSAVEATLARLAAIARRTRVVHPLDLEVDFRKAPRREAAAVRQVFDQIGDWKRDGLLATRGRVSFIEDHQVARLRRRGIPAAEREQLVRVAYLDLHRQLVALNSSSATDAREMLAGVLHQRFGVSAAALRNPQGAGEALTLREQDRRIANAASALLEGDTRLSVRVSRVAIASLAQHGGAGEIEVLDRLAVRRPALAAEAAKAISSIQRALHLKVAFASWEARPFAGTGGLANVTRELASSLVKMGHQAYVFVPRHAAIDRKQLEDLGLTIQVPLPAAGNVEVRLLHKELDGVHYIFLENAQFFSRNRPGLYVDSTGRDYADNPQRYDLLGAAMPVALRALAEHVPEIVDGPPDIVHINDAHPASAADAIAVAREAGDGFFRDTRTLFAIHNMGKAYQGEFDASHAPTLSFANQAGPGGAAELNGRINNLKLGASRSDAVMTVSGQYRREIQTERFGGDLAGLMRQLDEQGRLFGHLNGMDAEVWDPSRDRFLAKKYRFSFLNMEGKVRVKQALQAKLKLSQHATAPLIAMVARVTEQKGHDDALMAMRENLAHDLRDVRATLARNREVQFVIMGDGDPDIIRELRALQYEHPRQVKILPWSQALEHQLYAAADLLLMPSRFEPGGLPQMYALRYLAIPIVRRVGGLEESIEQWNPRRRTGTGFKFYGDVRDGLEPALDWYRAGPAHRQALLRNAALADFAWETTAAVEQAALYRRLIDRRL